MSDIAEYGKALFLLTEEEGSTERVAMDVRCLRGIFKDNPDYPKLLDTPALSKAERVKLVDASLSSLDTALVNTVKILAEGHLSYLTVKMADAYLALYDSTRGIERVEAVTARPLDKAQTERLTARLAAMTGKRIVIKNTVDPSILGGMKLRYSGTQLDGSVRTRLDALEGSLSGIVV